MEDIVLDGIQIQVDSANKSSGKTESGDTKSIKIESSNSLPYKQIIKIESAAVSHLKSKSAKSFSSKENSVHLKVNKDKFSHRSKENDIIKVELTDPSDDIIDVKSICELADDIKTIKIGSVKESNKNEKLQQNEVNSKNANTTLETITQKVQTLSVKK